MSLTQILQNYFDKNTDVASEAMHEDLFGSTPWYPKGTPDSEKKGYQQSEFEIWADTQDIKANLVDSYGGEEQGSTYYSVYEFTQGDEKVYLKFEGWYASYNGAEYTGFSVVHPKEVTKIEYV